MGRRFKSRTMRFGVPLSVPGSRYVEHCYGKHGKGYGGCPPRGSELELVMINAQRQLWRVAGFFPEPHTYVTDAVGLGGDGWKILGWRMADGSMRTIEQGVALRKGSHVVVEGKTARLARTRHNAQG